MEGNFTAAGDPYDALRRLMVPSIIEYLHVFEANASPAAVKYMACLPSSRQKVSSPRRKRVNIPSLRGLSAGVTRHRGIQ